MKISDKTFVALNYKLNVGEGEDLELMEETSPENPLTFIFGTGSMLPAFEDKISGLKKGDAFSFVISPEDAYGEFNEEFVLELPKSIFEVDGKFDDKQVFEGNILPMTDSEGNRMSGSVMEVREDVVVMDFNHPLAGEILNFEGQILEVHDATPEEIAALSYSSGCGGGCDCSGCDDKGAHACGCN